jgi:hypothetical protein
MKSPLFLSPVILGVFLSLLPAPKALSAELETPKMEKHRLILCNDGGTLGAPNMEAPIGVAGLVKSTIDPLRGTMVDTLIWQLGTDPYFGTATARLSDWYSHDTKVGARWGEGRTQFKTAGEWRIFQNAQELDEEGIDPPRVVIAEGHKAGIEVFLGLRINDGHDSFLKEGLDDPNMSPTKSKHRDWLLGDDAALLETASGKILQHSRTGYNFALPEVRDYMLALIKEAIANYDLDGFDLDFDRQPSLFKKADVARGSEILVTFLRQVRDALDAKAKISGRKLYFSVRVPPEIEANRRIGLDVAAWIKQHLVDIVVVGDPGGWNYRLPVEPYVALAKGTGCKIIAQDLCAYREDRGRSASVLFGERNYYTTEQFRAVAARHWMAGVDGQYIWNQHFLKYSADDKFDPQHWKEIGDPETLARKDKHYLVGPVGRGGNLPLTLATGSDPDSANVEIADDPSAAGYRAVLRVEIEQLTDLDNLKIRFNGALLDRTRAIERLNYNDCWLDFDVTGITKKGNNACTFAVAGRNPHVQAPLVVRSVEALISYH